MIYRSKILAVLVCFAHNWLRSSFRTLQQLMILLYGLAITGPWLNVKNKNRQKWHTICKSLAQDFHTPVRGSYIEPLQTGVDLSWHWKQATHTGSWTNTKRVLGKCSIMLGLASMLTERFFRRSVLSEESCLNYLLPDKHDSSVTGRLRHEH